MIHASRKIVYPIFVIIFSLTFFALLFLVFFNQGLEVSEATVSIIGSDVVLKMNLHNNSMHRINGIEVIVSNSQEKNTFFLKRESSVSSSSLDFNKEYVMGNSATNSYLDANESYDFVASLPLSNSLRYEVFVSAPFNRTIPLDFTLEQSTIDPVKAEVSLLPQLFANVESTYSVKLCNISGTDLAEVIWVENAESGAFKENFFERSVSLKVSECKTIPSTLTPLKTGNITIGFTLKVGTIEKKTSKVLHIVSEN
jgi:hypothetical protein